jgi:hypothetical protein
MNAEMILSGVTAKFAGYTLLTTLGLCLAALVFAGVASLIVMMWDDVGRYIKGKRTESQQDMVKREIVIAKSKIDLLYEENRLRELLEKRETQYRQIEASKK